MEDVLMCEMHLLLNIAFLFLLNTQRNLSKHLNALELPSEAMTRNRPPRGRVTGGSALLDLGLGNLKGMI